MTEERASHPTTRLLPEGRPKEPSEADRQILSTLDRLQQAAAIYDRHDRLAGFNLCYAAVWPEAGRKFRIGMSRRELAEVLWDNDIGWPGGDREAFIDRLLSEHKQTYGPVERELSDGRLFRVQRADLGDGRVLASLVDITPTASRSETFTERARSYREAALSVADWLWETDEQHCFVQPDFAPGRLQGEVMNFLGKTRWEVLGTDPDTDAHWHEHRAVLEAHLPFRDFRYEHARPDGSMRRSRISGSPMFDDDGQFLGYVGVGVDETRLAEADTRATAAEQRVQEAIGSLNEGIAMHDPDGSLTVWNETFEQIYSRSSLELRRGMSFEEVVTELARTGLIEHPGQTADEWLRNRLNLPRPNPEEVERRIDGRWYRLRETATPSGGLAILMTDITLLKEQQTELMAARDHLESRVKERTSSLADAVARAKEESAQRNEAEKRLKNSESKFRSIAEGASQGFYVQHDFKLVYANPAFADLLGYAGTDDLMSLTTIATFLAPDVRETLLQRNAARAAGETEPSRYQTRFLQKDGQEIWVELFVSQIVWDGLPSVLVSVVDIDSRKRAQDALLEAESDYRAIFEHASDGIYRSSIDGVNIRANPALARMNGFKDEEDVRNSKVDVEGSWYVEPGRREEFVEAVMRDGEVRNFVSEVYRYKTREKMWISENARLIRDENGEPLYFEGTVRDITEQRKVEMDLRDAMAEAERANYAKSQFLAKMSHELRTPLNAIIGFSDIIRDQMMGPVGSDRYVSYASDIRNSGRHLLSLINDLLDLSKIEAGEIELDMRPISITEIINESSSIIGPLAKERGIDVRVNSDPRTLEVMGDRRSLKQILLNLLSNAVKFNRNDGWIEVRTSGAGGICCVDVVDSGIGIERHDLHYLFTPFGQISNQMIAEHEGTGLGLPIVKSLVELHGGRVSVRSRPGEGTTMTIELPLAP